MPLDRIYKNDTAIIQTELFSDDEVTPVNPASVSWDFVKPDGRSLIVDSLPLDPLTGEVVIARGSLVVNTITYPAYSVFTYNGGNWSNVAPNASSLLVDNSATLTIPASATSIVGPYRGLARFTMSDGTVQSQPIPVFEVVDILATPEDAVGIDIPVERAWMKLEDLFDSELGGPWLSDKTFAHFDRNKLKRLLPDALYTINNYYQPTTSFDDTNFPINHYPLVTQALLVEGIYHLIRSYVEQPMPTGSNISYFDRRDYLSRWQSVLEKEESKLNQLVDIFKMEYTGFGATAVLVGGYGTPLTRMSRYWRMRLPRWIGPWTG
jgi:hypothetical protein